MRLFSAQLVSVGLAPDCDSCELSTKGLIAWHMVGSRIGQCMLYRCAVCACRLGGGAGTSWAPASELVCAVVSESCGGTHVDVRQAR
jgi:hypothetical protein